jgi:DNA-binding PadR family transcriptional regulator
MGGRFNKQHRVVLTRLNEASQRADGSFYILPSEFVATMQLHEAGLVEARRAENGQLEFTGLSEAGKRLFLKPLTDKQCVALIQARDFGLGPWDCAAGTLGSLKKLGLVTNRRTRVNNEGVEVEAANDTKYRITEEGLRRLAESGGR